MTALPLFNDSYLFSHWSSDFRKYLEADDANVLAIIKDWSERDTALTETQLEGRFVEAFFHRLWGYWGTGTQGPVEGYTVTPQFAVAAAGQSGGTGAADAALGHFKHPAFSDVPQVLCEFKDIKSGLDAPQRRKANKRSPVQQAFDYLKHAFDKAPSNAPVKPAWAVVTDMNEFRLYSRRTGQSACMRFVIDPKDPQESLLSSTDEGARARFLFSRIFSREMLLAEFGTSALELLLEKQWNHERALENSFYAEYKAYREHVYEAILQANPNYQGTRGQLVTMTQRFLDRCIFLLFCEDMGKGLDFPTDLLRDLLIRESLSPTYSPDFDNIWALLKQLFRTMRDGGLFPPNHQIHRFNGGLFDDLQELEGLRLPNRIFCSAGQGESTDALKKNPNTLLYLSATYNFGTTQGSTDRTITLYALGRIFEQSITELEYMRAAADGAPSTAALSKRKRDGVYYTPEWVTSYIVQRVVGGRLEDEKARLDLEFGRVISESELTKYQAAKRKKPKDNKVSEQLQKFDEFEVFLRSLRILDPACGSGAFLIQALQFLIRQHQALSIERERLTGQPSIYDQDAVVRSVLENNLFGVDINPESVELTQLALWLNTAAPGKPLTSLANNIQCGNSLVGKEFDQFYASKQQELFATVPLEEKEKVRPFDWSAAFPHILGSGVARKGFDCVIGNPPYVKLQHFRKVVPDVAEFLVQAKRGDGNPIYRSTQTGNYDLYLPFIERGISLLHEDGKMGYIAPSVWLLNEYGAGLKQALIETRALEGWVDFKDFPVFDEAMTYTALQFFSGKTSDQIQYAAAPEGDLSSLSNVGAIRYAQLDPDSPWIFLPDEEASVVQKLSSVGTRLIDVDGIPGIFQGVITSADWIYQLERIAPNRYLQKIPKQEPREVSVEDAIMKPLVSGTEAKRYASPATTTFILFPYAPTQGAFRLLPADKLASDYPLAWKHLCEHEGDLRSREKGAFDDEKWFRFGRNQNIDKQHLPKLGVAQTVPEMRVFFDRQGEFVFNNVRVNGIVLESELGAFLLGVLNARAIDFVFRRTSQPKEPRPSGSYFEANKQYIAPLPVPPASESERAAIANRANGIEQLHTRRSRLLDQIDLRLASPQMVSAPKDPDWLWADIGSKKDWNKKAPSALKGRVKTAWVKETIQERLGEHLDELDTKFEFGQKVLPILREGELRLFVEGRCVLQGVFVRPQEAELILAQWEAGLRDLFISKSVRAARVVSRLLDLKTTENEALREQIRDLLNELHEVEAKILVAEAEQDEAVEKLFGLTTDERRVVHAATAGRVRARLPNRAECIW